MSEKVFYKHAPILRFINSACLLWLSPNFKSPFQEGGDFRGYIKIWKELIKPEYHWYSGLEND